MLPSFRLPPVDNGHSGDGRTKVTDFSGRAFGVRATLVTVAEDARGEGPDSVDTTGYAGRRSTKLSGSFCRIIVRPFELRPTGRNPHELGALAAHHPHQPAIGGGGGCGG
jgi:hypothetical protein